jgi:hypothetical protein
MDGYSVAWKLEVGSWKLEVGRSESGKGNQRRGQAMGIGQA